jgi:hypothetical protein
MEPSTISTTIAVLFLTKALEKTGEKFGEGIVAKMGQALAKIGDIAPEISVAVVMSDRHILSLHGELLTEMIPAEPIFEEFLAAAAAEPNAILQAKLPDVKAGKILEVMSSINGANFQQTVPDLDRFVEYKMSMDFDLMTDDLDFGDFMQV